MAENLYKMEIMEDNFTGQLRSLIPYVYSISYKLTTDSEEAEDLAQETFLTAWEKRTQLSDVEKLKPWLRKIALNLFLSDKRKKKVKTFSAADLFDAEKDGERFEFISPFPTPEEEVIADETVMSIRSGCFLAMARKLTLEQRITFSLSEMFGLSLDDISEIMEISVPAVKGLLFRARKNIFNFFSERCEWINPSATCKCSAWVDFAGRKELNRCEVSGKRMIEIFPENAEERKIKNEHRGKIVALYRNLPEYVPDDEWYKKISETVKKLI